jgi:PAS domain S-box-containing protein
MNEDYLDSLFQVIFDHPSIGATINDDQKIFLKVNKKFCEMLGYSESELIGKSPLEFTLAEDIEKSRIFHTTVMTPDLGNGEYEKRFRRKDGSILWVRVIAKTIIHPKDPKQSISFVLVEDISSQKEIKAQADFNQMQLNAILETSTLGVWCVDFDWKITYSNKALQKMLGYSESQLANINLRQLTHPEDLIDTNSRFVQTKPGEFYQAYRRYKKFDETYLWVRLSVSKFAGENIQLYGLAMIEDVSEQIAAESTIKNQQAKLITSAKMAALGEMAGGMAHEINNPLTIIVGKLRRISRTLDSPEIDINKIKQDVLVAETTATRIAKIIKGLQAFSRDGEKDPFSLISIDEIIDHVEALCLEKFKAHGVMLKIEKKPDSKIDLCCRPTQIIQALISILSNSFDALEKKNEKWISVEVEKYLDEKITITITDAGEGIPLPIASKMMQPFFSTKPTGQGTGIGLSVAVGIIEEHNGTLIYDDSCKNTRFIIEIPITDSLLYK